MKPWVLALTVTGPVLCTDVDPSGQYWNQPVQGLVVVSARQETWACRVAPVDVTSVGCVAQPRQPEAARQTVASTATVRARSGPTGRVRMEDRMPSGPRPAGGHLPVTSGHLLSGETRADA